MKGYIESDTASITDILWNCFGADFQRHPQCQEHADRVKSSFSWPSNLLPNEYGLLLHEYIVRFYDRGVQRPGSTIAVDTHLKQNPNISAKNIKSMLKQLKSTKTSAIIDDKVYALLRNGNKTHLYRDLNIELRYFYKFVRDKHLVPYAVEYDIEDSEFRRVGRVNALFRIKRYKYADDKLMLYDWMRSRYMIPGSLTWMKKTIQMNIYKYILEKFYYKKIVKMVVVVLHRDNDKSTYEQIKIDDIGFRFDAQPMAKRGKKEKK